MQELIPTPYGEVRAEALEKLQSSFDTRCLLSAADQFDRFCAHWKSELRDELFKVHCMAHTVINGAPMTRAPGKESLTETAYSLGASRVASVTAIGHRCVGSDRRHGARLGRSLYTLMGCGKVGGESATKMGRRRINNLQRNE